jgi:hypothetical protein
MLCYVHVAYVYMRRPTLLVWYSRYKVVGSCICETQGGERVWAKTQKPSHGGSVSGAPGKTATGDIAEGCGGDPYEVMVVVGLCVHETRGGERVWTKKTETELLWLSFGLQWGCRRWRGVLWGCKPPSCAKLEGEDGG